VHLLTQAQPGGRWTLRKRFRLRFGDVFPFRLISRLLGDNGCMRTNRWVTAAPDGLFSWGHSCSASSPPAVARPGRWRTPSSAPSTSRSRSPSPRQHRAPPWPPSSTCSPTARLRGRPGWCPTGGHRHRM